MIGYSSAVIGEFVKLRGEWTARKPGTSNYYRVPAGTIMLVHRVEGPLLSGTVAHGPRRKYEVERIHYLEVVLATPLEVIAKRAEEN